VDGTQSPSGAQVYMQIQFGFSCLSRSVSTLLGPNPVVTMCSAERDSVCGEKTVLMRVYVPVARSATKDQVSVCKRVTKSGNTDLSLWRKD
jgi:hypothetical protein